MSCPPAERLLEFASGSLPDDAAASIEKHIDDCSDCRAVLSNVARGDAPPSFGRYRIDTVLGSGGMGIVYRAWDPQLARPIAIKVVRRGGEDTQGRARLVREAQALARLSHPNVCHVYDVGTDGDEVWVAMELIDGVSLRQWADQTRTRDEILGVLIGAANGIAAAHDAGLVHRDVKPENVLITRDGRAIVTDFGLARTEDKIDPNASTLSTDPHLTATGAIAGTPAYIAPEQLTGDPIDARVDQFAWAVMAWEMLVGARPFPIIFAARIEAAQNGLKPPAALPPAMGAALVKAMAYVPRERFASMRELITAITEAHAPPPAPKKPPTENEMRSRRAAIAGMAVLAASGIAIGAWLFTHGGHHPDAQPPAPSPAVATVETPRLTPLPSVSTPPPPSDAAVAPPPAVAVVPKAHTLAPKAATPAPAPPPKHAPPQGTEDLAPSNSSTLAAVKATQSAAHATGASYCRSCMVGAMTEFCQIPPDPAHVTGRTFGVLDWGKVIKVQDEVGTFREEAVTDTIITVQGQRGVYRLPAEFLNEHVEASVGELLAFCPEDESEVYQLTGGPTMKSQSVITLSAPPRLPEIAKLKFTHVSVYKLIGEGLHGVFSSFDPNGRYLIHAEVKKPAGSHWQMDRFALDVPAGTPGAKLIASGKRLWFVIDHLRFEPDDTGKQQLVVDAAYVLDDLFP